MLRFTAPFKRVYSDANKEEIERQKAVYEAYKNFYQYYNERKIYFQLDICFTLDDIVNKYWEYYLDYTEVNDLKQWGMPNSELLDSFKKAKEASKNVREEIPKVLKKLEDEFRKLLGVNDSLQ